MAKRERPLGIGISHRRWTLSNQGWILQRGASGDRCLAAFEVHMGPFLLFSFKSNDTLHINNGTR